LAWQLTHTRIQFLVVGLSALRLSQQFASLWDEEAVEITGLGRPGLEALRPIWQQTHARVQFLELDCSAFRPCPAIHLPVEVRVLWKLCDLEGLDPRP
jgi:hypothetical protein